VEGEGTLQFDFARVPLLDGIYTVSIGIHSHDVADHLRPPQPPGTRSR
jgi:hypothetical protein